MNQLGSGKQQKRGADQQNAAALRNLPTDQVTDQPCERGKGKKALELATETIDMKAHSMA